MVNYCCSDYSRWTLSKKHLQATAKYDKRGKYVYTEKVLGNVLGECVCAVYVARRHHTTAPLPLLLFRSNNNVVLCLVFMPLLSCLPVNQTEMVISLSGFTELYCLHKDLLTKHAQGERGEG